MNNTNYHSFLKRNSYQNKFILADQTASGSPLKCIERFINKNIYPYYTNVHSNNCLGQLMGKYLQHSREYIKKCIRADDTHAVIFTGQGATGAVNHFVGMLKPILKNAVVFVSETEHFSNYLPWLESEAEIKMIRVKNNGLIDLEELETELKHVSNNKQIIVSTSACSNITGVIQDTLRLSEIAKKYNAIVAFDYAASAPYVEIDMRHADAIFISPHKLPGAQGTPGLLVCKKDICKRDHPVFPGGGTVRFVSKSDLVYASDFQQRESGGTPNIIGVIKIALAFWIKKKYQADITRECKEHLEMFNRRLIDIKNRYPRLEILNPMQNDHRLPIFIFRIKPFHYNYVVKLMSDLFGILVRGGVSCAGVYAERLLGTDSEKTKKEIIENRGVPAEYGFVRVTLHSIHNADDITRIGDAIEFICEHGDRFINDYLYDPQKNTFMKCP